MRSRIAGACLLLSLGAGPLSAQGGSYEEWQRFSEIVNHVRANYVDSVTVHSLVRAAIDGMLKALDPHSYFVAREDFVKLNALERGELAVTGISLELADGLAIVLDVVDGSPADKSGVRPGDRILSVNGEPMAGVNAHVVSLKLAGPKGSTVRVLVERGPRLDPDSVTVTLKREMPKPVQYIRDARMLDATTGYLRLNQFGEKSADQLKDAIKKLRGDKATQLVLDLRGNPGGIVTEAVKMAEAFLPSNSLIFTTRGRQKTVNQEFRTSGGGEFRNMPMVVLVDQRSASASEALAASLQDHDRAVIAGRRSFGKALMQTLFIVPDGNVWLTIGHVISPSGRFIQRRYSGMAIEQYYAFAGDSSWQDTTALFKTEHGRKVKGGGGVAPDVALPSPPTVPRWFTVAADSGWDRLVADSVANTLGADAAARAAWRSGEATWADRLLPPLLDRVRKRIGVQADMDAATRAAMARRLAARVATVRWGDDAGSELGVMADPDVVAARGLFGRLKEILGSP